MAVEPDMDEEVQLEEGMPVRNEEGEELGSLAGMLVAEEEEEAEFILVECTDTAERLVPFEAVLGIADGAILLDVPSAAMVKFPKVRPETDPTDDEIDLAYQVYDENAIVGPAEEGEE